MSSSARRHQSMPDIFTKYHKLVHGNTESAAPSKKWLDMLEEQIIIFLGKLFCVKEFEKPLKNAKYLESCINESGGQPVRETNLVLFSVAHLVNMLNEKLLCEVLPMMSNLIFLTKYDLCSVKNHDAKRVVLKFQEMLTSPGYISCSNPHARLQKLMDIVDSIRKYSEHLLRISGYSLEVARSPREILRDIHQVRSKSTL